MNAQHTPGPWHVGDYLQVCAEQMGCRPANRICGVAGTGKRAVANALLIAAAPDMLHALQKIMELTPDESALDAQAFAGAAIGIALAHDG